MPDARPINNGAGLPTSSEGLEPVTKIDSKYYEELRTVGIELQELPKIVERFSLKDLAQIVLIIEKTIVDIVEDYRFIKKWLVDIGILKPLSKESKVHIINTYALTIKALPQYDDDIESFKIKR